MFKKENKGFTIIEVLIVLAIAGLIMLIVFLAVPALQRNSRNTSIKNDAQLFAGAVGDHRASYNGTTPTVTEGTGTITLSGGGTSTVTLNGSTPVAIPTDKPNADTMVPGTLYVASGRDCNYSQSARTVAIWFVTETSGSGEAVQCIEG